MKLHSWWIVTGENVRLICANCGLEYSWGSFRRWFLSGFMDGVPDCETCSKALQSHDLYFANERITIMAMVGDMEVQVFTEILRCRSCDLRASEVHVFPTECTGQGPLFTFRTLHRHVFDEWEHYYPTCSLVRMRKALA